MFGNRNFQPASVYHDFRLSLENNGLFFPFHIPGEKVKGDASGDEKTNQSGAAAPF